MLPALQHALEAIPDPCSPCGRRYSLPTVLTIILAGLLAQHTLAITEWATVLPPLAR